MSKECKQPIGIAPACLIITSEDMIKFLNDNSEQCQNTNLMSHCYCKKLLEYVPFARSYEIFLDFKNPQIHEVAEELLNILMRLKCLIKIHLINFESEVSNDKSLKTLSKLNVLGLIELQDIFDKKSILRDRSLSQIKNVFSFVGPGNTGKTSLISSVSELFEKSNYNLAIVDLSKEQKLKDYFYCSSNLSSLFLDTESVESNDENNETHREFIDFYNYEVSEYFKVSEAYSIYEKIMSLSKIYDYVIVNSDIEMLNRYTNIFNIFYKIFLVQDCSLNKLTASREILLKLREYGIDTIKSVAIVYNKLSQKAYNLRLIEENTIFEKDVNGRLTPMVDVGCETLEIYYSKKTMNAINKKYLSKKNSINNASINYYNNIEHLYRIMNNEQTECKTNRFAWIYLMIRNYLGFLKHRYEINPQ